MFVEWLFCCCLLLLKIMVSPSPATLPTHPKSLSQSLLALSAGIRTSGDEFRVLEAFSLETYSVRLWQTLFYYPSNISLFTI